LYESQGRYAEAEPLYKEALAIKAKVLGKEHPSYATSCNNLAELYESQGRYAEAELLRKEAQKVRDK
jgi:tetratricopeptide (TPR) repeat protein